MDTVDLVNDNKFNENLINNMDHLQINDRLTCLTIGDPHFKTKNKKETDEMIEKSIELAKTLNPDFIVILGDVLDTHEKIHVVPLTQAINWIERMSKISTTYVLIGNHDRPNNSDFLSGYHPFNGLKDSNNIIIVDTAIEIEIKEYKFLFVPYVPCGRFIEAISTIIDIDDINSYSTIFAHQEFFGAKMGAIISTHGDKWPLTYPFIISGHIHDYCRPQENIVYTGTPLQHAFGDSTHKTVSYYSFNNIDNINMENIYVTKQEELIKNIFEYRIDLNLPKKRIYRLNPEEVLMWEPPDNSLIKVIIRGTNAQIKATNKLDIIKIWEKKGIKIDYKTIDDHIGISNIDNLDIISNDQVSDKRFIYKLYERVNTDPGMKIWYERLFSFNTT
uniref:DNA repair exonuclease n=1 Tax=Pithovirus LCPAC102 TaxID=2506587 RepID=A0A481Z5C5_9VIRU|nr:MAG: DNA repair exonuclease [Pithovirus LCPAC102]